MTWGAPPTDMRFVEGAPGDRWGTPSPKTHVSRGVPTDMLFVGGAPGDRRAPPSPKNTAVEGCSLTWFLLMGAPGDPGDAPHPKSMSAEECLLTCFLLMGAPGTSGAPPSPKKHVSRGVPTDMFFVEGIRHAVRQRVKVGTDCSGMEVPIMALNNLSIDYEHTFSCDNDPHAIQTIKANFEPQTIYPDVATRDNSKVPSVDLYVAGFSMSMLQFRRA